MTKAGFYIYLYSTTKVLQGWRRFRCSDYTAVYSAVWRIWHQAKTIASKNNILCKLSQMGTSSILCLYLSSPLLSSPSLLSSPLLSSPLLSSLSSPLLSSPLLSSPLPPPLLSSPLLSSPSSLLSFLSSPLLSLSLSLSLSSPIYFALYFKYVYCILDFILYFVFVNSLICPSTWLTQTKMWICIL